MSLIYASFFEDIKMALSALYSQHVGANLPKAAAPSHIPQPLQLKKKNPKHLHLPSFSSLHPSLHQLSSEYAMSLLSLSSPPL